MALGMRLRDGFFFVDPRSGVYYFHSTKAKKSNALAEELLRKLNAKAGLPSRAPVTPSATNFLREKMERGCFIRTPQGDFFTTDTSIHSSKDLYNNRYTRVYPPGMIQEI